MRQPFPCRVLIARRVRVAADHQVPRVDPRVAPWHSRKFTAALQAAQAGDAPILLRTSDTAGHGMGTSTSEYIDQLAHRYAFILEQI